MGMTIRTYIAPDEYGGRGVFADEPVKAGAVVWRFEPEFTAIYTIDEYKAALARDPDPGLRKYSYPVEFYENGEVIRYVYNDLDNGKHMNHSEAPNIGMIEDPHHPDYARRDVLNIALRDIQAGDQLTYDYWSFVSDIGLWLDVETCMQFLIDAGLERKLA